MHRLFIGVSVSPEITEKITSWQSAHPDISVNPIRPQNLHLTLLPPWQTEDSQAEISKLQNFTSPSFLLPLTQITQTPQVIWARATLTPQIQELKNQLTKHFSQTPEDRSFIPHVTLAHKSQQNFPTQKINWHLPISNITLYESSLHTPGSDYRMLAQTILN